jgi:hypothetical protein
VHGEPSTGLELATVNPLQKSRCHIRLQQRIATTNLIKFGEDTAPPPGESSLNEDDRRHKMLFIPVNGKEGETLKWLFVFFISMHA